MRQIWLITITAVLPAFGTTLNSIPPEANSFGLLGGSVSNTGTSLVIGNVGATSTVTGFPPGTATGFVCMPTSLSPCTSGNDSEVTSAYNAIFGAGGAFSTSAGLISTGAFSTATSQTFLGNTVYASPGTISTATGTSLVFDAQGDPTQSFVIQIKGDFTVNGALTFTLENGAQASNIFWIVQDAATISVGSFAPITFDGNILAGSTFTMTAATGGSGVLTGTINGCVFSQTANTLAGQTDVSGCADASSVPEPAYGGLMSVAGLVAFLWLKSRTRP